MVSLIFLLPNLEDGLTLLALLINVGLIFFQGRTQMPQSPVVFQIIDTFHLLYNVKSAVIIKWLFPRTAIIFIRIRSGRLGSS